MPKIPLYPSSVAPNEDDLLVIEDSVTSNTKKIKRSDLLGGALITATNGLKSDTIVEKTAAAGVTADGVKMKDGFVVGGAGTGVANSSLDTTAGEIGGAWKNYTPTWTNLTVGNGELGYARYSRIGKTVQWFVLFTFGSTTSVTGNVSVSPPVNTGPGVTTSAPIALATYIRAGDNAYPGYIGGQGGLYAHGAAGTYTIRVSVNASVPFIWGEGDIIILNGTYEGT